MSRLRCVSRATNDRTGKERKTEEKIPETRPTIANGIEYIHTHDPRRSNLPSINKPARPSRVIALTLSILSTPRDCRGQTISREEAFRNFAAGTICLRADMCARARARARVPTQSLEIRQLMNSRGGARGA